MYLNSLHSCIGNCICISVAVAVSLSGLDSLWRILRAIGLLELFALLIKKFSFIVWALLSSILYLSLSLSIPIFLSFLQFNRSCSRFPAVPTRFSFSLSINPLIIADFVGDYKSPESVFIFYLDISRKRVLWQPAYQPIPSSVFAYFV